MEVTPAKPKKVLFRRLKKIGWKWWLAISLLALFFLPGLAFTFATYVGTAGIVSNPDPLEDYDAAVSAIDEMLATENELALNPVSHSRFMSHGEKTEYAIVLYHGLTNSPYQFEKFGGILHDMGSNVFIPRIPHHGMADNSVRNLSNLKAKELAAFADRTVDIANGLGDRVVVAGLSAGGVIAAFVTQNREEVEMALLIAPAMGFLPTRGARFNKLAFLIVPMLPDIVSEPKEPGPNARAHIYQGFSTRSLGELLRLSVATFRGAAHGEPAVKQIALVTSDTDGSVNEFINWNLVTFWRAKGMVDIRAHKFPEALAIEHDMIDPTHPKQQIDIVYPVLLDTLPVPKIAEKE